jgi:4-amino-4-deoxy-L-arabinose transferase-like glycosyltransferase
MLNRGWVALVVVAGAVILASAPIPHVDSDAPLYARIALNVLASGDWLTFHHPGWFVDKPPVVFWLMAASFDLFGVSAVTMRLWQLLMAVGMLGIVAAASRAAGGSREEATLAALVLGTSLQFFYQATVPQQDVPLTFFLTLAAYGLLRYTERGAARWAALTGAAVGLAVLTKGIAGAALFGAVALLAYAFVRRSLPRRGARLAGDAALGAAACAVVAMPWYAYGALQHGDAFIATFFTSGTLGIARFVRPAISTPPPYWIAVFAYVPMLLLGLLPWTPALLAGAGRLIRTIRSGSTGMAVVAAWFAAVFLLLSASSGDKVFRYLLPCLPPAAILTARALMVLQDDGQRLRLAGWLALVPALALAAAGYWMLWAAFPPERGLLVAVVLPTVAALAAGLVAFGAAALVGRARVAVAAAALAALLGYALFERNMLVHAAAVNPWPGIAEAAAPHQGAASRLVLYGRAGEAFNFAHFHFDAPVVNVTAAHELAALWRREPLLVVVPPERLDDLLTFAPAPVVLFRSPGRLVLVANWAADAR